MTAAEAAAAHAADLIDDAEYDAVMDAAAGPDLTADHLFAA